MKFPKLTLRDLFWLVLVAGMALGWGIESQREKMDRKNALKLWAFDIAASILEEQTGSTMTVDEGGVTVMHPNRTADVYSFGGK